MRRTPAPRRTRTQIVLAGAALLLASVVAAPVVLYLAKRPKPKPYRDELRERHRLATLLEAETEFSRDWTRRGAA